MLFFFKHLFLPHPGNNHKAKILHASSLVAAILFVMIIQLIFQIVTLANPKVLGVATDISTEKLLELVNKKRSENGFMPFKKDSLLSQAAVKKANDMFVQNYWSHYSPIGKPPWDFITGVGYRYLYAGENLARDFATSEQVVSAWMASSTHRQNLLQEKFSDVGLGVVNGRLNGEETTLVVALFGTKQSLASTVSSISQPRLESETLLPKVAGVSNKAGIKPILDTFQTTKSISYLLGILLVLVLAVDAYLIGKKKIIRVSGSNLAHMVLIIFVLTAIYLTKGGSIL